MQRATGSPAKRASAGATNSCAVTRQETGLPGSAKNKHGAPLPSLRPRPTSLSDPAKCAAHVGGGAHRMPAGPTPAAAGLGSTAKVVGLPGFISRRPKRIVPPNLASTCASNGIAAHRCAHQQVADILVRQPTCLSRSASPIETPPEVTTTSHRAAADASAASSPGASSGLAPRSITSAVS